MKIFKIFITIFLTLLPVFSFAQTAQFSFSTETQTLTPNELSGAITIHSVSPVTETTYILLSSTSNSGQFFSSKTSTEALQSGAYVYISSGNSNRTVYYKDSVEGSFSIKADIFNKDKSTKLESLSQNIQVGQSTSNNASTTTHDTNSNTQTQSNVSNNTSAHGSPAPIGATLEETIFEISAGRDRLTTVGNSLQFQAKPTKLSNISEQGIGFTWSFGDGTTASGNTVFHSYKFAGEYAVVVNAQFSDNQAVSRLKVKVISPEVLIKKVSGGVEIENKSQGEINLEDWSLNSSKKIFTFPRDTLIPSNKKVIFADEVTGMLDENLELRNPLGKSFGSIVAIPISETPHPNFSQIEAGIEVAKKELSVLQKSEVGPKTVESPTQLSEKNETEEDSSNQVANTIEVFKAEKSTGLINKLFAWPIKGLNWATRLFVEE